MSEWVKNVPGVPDYTVDAFREKRSDYCLLIPIINEGKRILTELERAQKGAVDGLCDIILCDGGSTDGSMEAEDGRSRFPEIVSSGQMGGLLWADTFGYDSGSIRNWISTGGYDLCGILRTQVKK